MISLLIGSRCTPYAAAMLPLTAGGFIYIAGCDLLPELQHEVRLSRSLLQFCFIVLGVGIMALLLALE